ncbi:MAG: hypothetical protein ACXV8Q_00680 [Methylobacter sp.]
MSTLLCYNSFFSDFNNFSFQEKYVKKSNQSKIQITVTAVEKKSKQQKVIIEKTMSLHYAILLFIVLSPFILIGLLFMLLWSAFSFALRGGSEPSYVEAKEYFHSGKGYLNNLSDTDKEKLFRKNENIPLGL